MCLVFGIKRPPAYLQNNHKLMYVKHFNLQPADEKKQKQEEDKKKANRALKRKK